MSFLWSLVSFLIVIGVLVTVHEYGHFWAAKKCGIKVHRFSIGFGKVLWKCKDEQGTEFALSLIPLGGYVKMLDERQETVPPHLRYQAFNHKPVALRTFVIAAGPLANFIFAILAYWVVYLVGVPTIKPVIEQVKPNSIAALAHLEENSQIVAIDGSSSPDWETVNMLLSTKIGQKNVKITFTSLASGIEQEKELDLSHWTFDPEKESSFGSIGIVPVGNRVEMTLSKVLENSPAEKAGLKVDDKLTALNGEKINWQQFAQAMKNSNGEPLQVTVDREGKELSLILRPEKNAEGRWIVGVLPKFIPVPSEYRTELKYGMLEAFQKGIEKTEQISWVTLKVIGQLFIGDLSLNNLSGPISIAKGASISSELGLVYYLSFMALISVNLGIMNLLPLPVLDGGHLLFLAIEGVRRKPLSEKIQNVAYRVGATLLLILSTFALFNDFLRL